MANKRQVSEDLGKVRRAEVQGFEPQLPDPESGVLPLDDTPSRPQKIAHVPNFAPGIGESRRLFLTGSRPEFTDHAIELLDVVQAAAERRKSGRDRVSREHERSDWTGATRDG
jgi:hypothetical protein